MLKKSYRNIFIMLLIAALVTSISGCSASKAEHLSLGCNYSIDARLDPYSKTLLFTEQAQIQNNGEADARELYFHLYGNFYQTETESIKVISITDDEGNAVKYSMEDSDQLIRVTLNKALKGTAETALIFNCEVTIPMMENRYGVARDGEIHLPFFYPQLAVHDKNGWNIEPMTDIGDGRYAGVSDYTLRIAAPSEYEVICNADELTREKDDNTTVYTFKAASRRDLVFFAFTDYVHMERTVGKTRILGYFNSSRSQISMEKVMEATAFSLELFNRIYVEYPYEALIITNGAWGIKSAQGGMEYSGAATVMLGKEDSGSFDFIDVAFHELAHQWFYSLVGNDENAEPWLDEGFATFSQWLCLLEWVQVNNIDDFDLDGYWEGVIQIGANAAEGIPINSAQDEVEQYTWVFYNRAACFIRELTDAIGEEAFLPIISEYCNLYAFKNAATQDFLDVLRERTPINVDAIIYRYIAI